MDDDAAPLAVAGDPAFGWLPRDDDPGEVQRAYEIAVYDVDTATDDHKVAGTGRVRSDQQSSVHITGLTNKLQPDRTYFWTVRTWDRSGSAGPFAPLARFDTAVADDDWRASWIRRPGAENATPEDYSLFLKEVRIGASPITRARVHASAGQHYELRVNGTRRAIGPSYAYPDEQYSETTDITSDVRAGAPNVFAFVTYWGQPGQGRPPSVPALIAQITIDHADGSRQTVTTDASWRTHTGPWIPDKPRNEEGDFVEHIDERRIPAGWDHVAFDDGNWAAAAVVGPAGVQPFTHLIPARTHIVEKRVQPVKFRRVGTDAFVADFGEVYAATPVVQVDTGQAGRSVTVIGGYELDPDGHVSRTRGIQDTDMTWHFDERGGSQQLRPFGYLAFRYLEIDGSGEQLTDGDVRIDARHASMPDEHASFDSPNPTLNAVWHLAEHSALYDSQEQFLDTPTREKGPFLGDSFDVSQATMAAFGERALTSQALRDFARSQARYWPDGRVNVVYPNGDGKRDIPDATQTYVEWVWQNYMTTGDPDQLAALYPVVRKISDYVARAIDTKTGLVTNLPGGGSDYLHGAVDWPPAMRYGYDMNTTARTMMNVLAVVDFQRVAAMGEALGRPAEDVLQERGRADSVARAIRERLTRPNGVLIDGLEANGAQSKHASQQANAWALAFGIVPAAQTKAVADYIVSLGNAMGVVYFRVLLDALHAAGHDDALIDALTDPNRPGYAQILKQGATFTWESWNAPEVGDSESHGWGATVLAVLLDDILGVHTTAPGSSAVEVRVPKTSLTRASGTVVTQRGPIPITWMRDSSGHETIDVVVPVNVTATVHLPAASIQDVNNKGGKVAGAPGVTEARAGGGDVAITLGSGHYVLENSRPTGGGSSGSTTTLVLVIAGTVVLLAAASFFALRARRRATR